jgi:hypothetical protein
LPFDKIARLGNLIAIYSKIDIIMTWHVETLNENVNDELNTLEPILKAEFLHIINLLETFGPNLP